MSYEELSPTALREMGYPVLVMKFSPELMALLLEEKAAMGSGYLVGVGRWTDDFVIDPVTGARIPVVTWVIRSGDATVPTPSSEAEQQEEAVLPSV